MQLSMMTRYCKCIGSYPIGSNFSLQGKHMDMHLWCMVNTMLDLILSLISIKRAFTLLYLACNLFQTSKITVFTIDFYKLLTTFMKVYLCWYKSWFWFNFWSKHKIYSYLGIFRLYSIFHQRVSDKAPLHLRSQTTSMLSPSDIL